jgi:hypothetical protein
MRAARRSDGGVNNDYSIGIAGGTDDELYTEGNTPSSPPDRDCGDAIASAHRRPPDIARTRLNWPALTGAIPVSTAAFAAPINGTRLSRLVPW